MIPKAVAGFQAASGRNSPSLCRPRCIVVMTVTLEPMIPTEGGPANPAWQEVVVQCEPSEVRIVRNAYAEPDTFSFTVEKRRMPFHPKQIKALQVAIKIWDGIDWTTPPVELEPTFQGLADEPDNSESDDGGWFTCSGVDYTSLFTQAMWDPKEHAPSGKPLNVILEALISQVAPGGVMRLAIEPPELAGRMPIVGSMAKVTKKKGLSFKPNTPYWEVMSRLAQLNGFVLFVRGTDVVLSRPREFTEASIDRAPKLVYGENISTLAVKRSLGKERTPTIQVNCTTVTGKVVNGRYPEKGQKAAVGIGTERDQIKEMTVEGISTESEARAYAQNYYEHVAKGEMSMTVETQDMQDRDGNQMLDVWGGDSVLVDFDAFNREDLVQMSVPERIAYLQSIGFDGGEDGVSAIVANNLERVDAYCGAFRVDEASISFDEDGLSFEYTLQDYVVAP